jgi:hypothetical protein
MQTTEKPTTNPTAPDWRALVSSRLVIGLGALLACQLVLALFLDMRSVSLSPAAAQGPLLRFTQADVSRIRITSGGKQSVVLAKTAKGWRIPSLWDFPAAEFRVTDLLRKLAGLRKRLPVATSQSALKRFKVADDAYERRVILEGGKGPLATLYVGESPSFRRVFVRAGDDKAVYEAEFALFDVSDKADDWSDRNALHLEEKDVQRIELPGIVLARDEKGAWKLAGLGAGETMDQLAVDDVVRKVSSIDFLSVLGKQDKPEYTQQKPVFQYKVQLASDETLAYRISKPEKGDDYVLKASNSPYYFGASKYTLDGLKDIKRASLIKAEKAKAKAAAPAAGKGQTPPPASAPAKEAPEAAVPAAQTPPAKPLPGGATPQAPAGQGQPPKAPGAAGPQAPAVQPAPSKVPSRAAQTPPKAAPAPESPSASAVPSASAKTPSAASPQTPAAQQPPAPASGTERALPASPSTVPTKAPTGASPATPAAQKSPPAPTVRTPTSKSPEARSPSAAPGQTPSAGTSAAEGAGSTASGSVPAAATPSRPGAGGQPPTGGSAASAGQGQAAPTQPAPAAQPAAPPPAAPAVGQQPPAGGAVQSSPAPGPALQE